MRALIWYVMLVASISAAAQEKPAPQIDAETLFSGIVQVKARALADARSNAVLGQAREGSGIVIDPAGYVLTIGYLVIEPDSIEIITANNKTVPAILAGYDHASGFGLLKALQPLAATPLPLGDSASLAPNDPVLILPHSGAATIGKVVSLREFTGSWEYLLERAIFTSPPTMAWAGAALVNREGKLVGVGSLLVRDSVEAGTPFPGNMFVPIDQLKPILADLKAHGRRQGVLRPWLGLATEEVQGRLVVTRVSPDGPAADAGINDGDIVLAVAGDDVKTRAQLYRKIWSTGPAGALVALKVLQGSEVKEIEIRSVDRTEYFRVKPSN